MLEITATELVIHDLVGGDSTRIDEYLELYTELFPEYIRYVPLMRRRAETPRDKTATERWHQWLLVVRGEPIGVLGFFHNRRRNVGVLMDFAIRQEARKIEIDDGRAIPQYALQLAMRQISDDALLEGKGAPLFMIAEVGPLALLRKYARYGYREFPVEYFEPSYPLEPTQPAAESMNLDKMEYRRMHLGAFQLPGRPFEESDPETIRTALLAMLVDHYGLPTDHWLVKKLRIDIIE